MSNRGAGQRTQLRDGLRIGVIVCGEVTQGSCSFGPQAFALCSIHGGPRNLTSRSRASPATSLILSLQSLHDSIYHLVWGQQVYFTQA